MERRRAAKHIAIQQQPEPERRRRCSNVAAIKKIELSCYTSASYIALYVVGESTYGLDLVGHLNWCSQTMFLNNERNRYRL